jgi:uncharacterized protein
MKHCDKKAVTVNPTNVCNLRCDYCMASSSEEQINPMVIPIDFALRGVHDALIGYPNGNKAEILRFFSPGEPTQNMEIIRTCVEYARHLYPKIQIELQTNGLFNSLGDTEWIANNIDAVWFSLDGPPEINDRNRPDKEGKGRTLEIEKNMALVAEKAFVGVRSTVVEETIDHQADLVDYYHGLGVKYLGLNPVIRQIRRKEDGTTEVTKINIMRFSKGFLGAYHRALELDMVLLSAITFNFDEPTEVACRSCLPMPQLNPDGSVSSCDMALYRDTKKELQCFIYGSWDEKTGKIVYDIAKIRHLHDRRLYNLPKCKNCEVGIYCAGGCAGRVAYQTGNIYDVIPEYCAATKFLARHMDLGRNVAHFTHP